MIIRAFQESDREDIRRICSDGAMGSYAKDPKKRKAISIIYVDYYMDCEPQNVLVAEDEGKVAGYIVCSTDWEKFQKEFPRYIKQSKKYAFLFSQFQKICLKTNRKLDRIYSGGFHISVDKDQQSKGIGKKLLTAMAEHLKQNGGKHMYLITKNRHTKGYGFYMHYGFKEVKRYPLGSLLLVYDIE